MKIGPYGDTAQARCGPTHRMGNIAFYACDGLIVVHDERKGIEHDRVITADVFENQVQAMVESVLPLRTSFDADDQQTYRYTLRAAAEATEAIKEAREMGDPTDPKVQEYLLRHHRSSSSLLPHARAQAEASTAETAMRKKGFNIVPPNLSGKRKKLAKTPKPKKKLIIPE